MNSTHTHRAALLNHIHAPHTTARANAHTHLTLANMHINTTISFFLSFFLFLSLFLSLSFSLSLSLSLSLRSKQMTRDEYSNCGQLKGSSPSILVAPEESSAFQKTTLDQVGEDKKMHPAPPVRLCGQHAPGAFLEGSESSVYAKRTMGKVKRRLVFH